MATRLFLDHLTLADAGPMDVIEAAQTHGYGGVCLFLRQIADLPRMPCFDLVADRQARRAVCNALKTSGLTLGLAYPFTLSARSSISQFEAPLDCAAELGAEAVNVLVYDRDPLRRESLLAEFSDWARARNLRVAVEFYPASQIKTLAAARDLVLAVNRPGNVGLNVDLLHLMRSGGTIEAVAALPDTMVLVAQLADGPLTRPESEWADEASDGRALIGGGDFDARSFVAALPQACRLSLEVPRPASDTHPLPLACDVLALLA